MNSSRKRNPAGMAILIGLATLVLIVCCIGAISVAGSSDDNTLPLITTTDAAGNVPAVTPEPAAKANPAARALTPKDFKLGVKITDKECFGSVVCNVEFKITLDVSVELLAASERDWTVTYEVTGVKDGPQVGQLTVHPDGTFEQDTYQFGQTPNKGTKLKAKATDVEPVL